MATALPPVDPSVLMDSLSEGIYVCDLDRRIVYWSKSAERITGWCAEEVVGRHCFENILCHVDKDRHKLCGKEYCPLHRSIITGTPSKTPLIVYAKGKDGQRIPTQVSVAPLRNREGEVIGGVETFRDVSALVGDMERARKIQLMSLHSPVPEDPRVRMTTHYVPHDVIGGDYYAIGQIDEDRYGFMLADVMGHGIAAALYTMHLSSLWQRHKRLLGNPVEFTHAVNGELGGLVEGDCSFATALCGLVDLQRRELRFVCAGSPLPLLVRADGTHRRLQHPGGVPLGVLATYPYEEVSAPIRPGDCLLLYSDGAVEITNAAGEMLGPEGLVSVLQTLDYPKVSIRMEALEEALLKYSNAIRLEDDLTFLEIRFELE